VKQKVRVLNAFSNTLVREQGADIVVGEKILELNLVYVRVDCQSSSPVDKGHVGLGELDIA
jgi:hypothetical protein